MSRPIPRLLLSFAALLMVAAVAGTARADSVTFALNATAARRRRKAAGR